MNSRYTERRYRKQVRTRGLVTFEVTVKETDLQVSAEKPLGREVTDRVLDARHQIETYIRLHPEFLTAMIPYPEDPYAPPLVREMIDCTARIGVGPMASVAGAIAQFVGQGLLRHTSEVIVENGGDIFIKVGRPATIAVFAGPSPLSGKLGLRIHPETTPLGVCTSSASVGHSYSAGIADAGCVLAPSAAFADGAATSLCNRIKNPEALRELGSWAEEIGGIMGALVILGDKMATWGNLELVAI